MDSRIWKHFQMKLLDNELNDFLCSMQCNGEYTSKLVQFYQLYKPGLSKILLIHSATSSYKRHVQVHWKIEVKVASKNIREHRLVPLPGAPRTRSASSSSLERVLLGDDCRPREWEYLLEMSLARRSPAATVGTISLECCLRKLTLVSLTEWLTFCGPPTGLGSLLMLAAPFNHRPKVRSCSNREDVSAILMPLSALVLTALSDWSLLSLMGPLWVSTAGPLPLPGSRLSRLKRTSISLSLGTALLLTEAQFSSDAALFSIIVSLVFDICTRLKTLLALSLEVIVRTYRRKFFGPIVP
ncbi:hypothetical protein TYRP_018852 [Tyrophagus putrescentiae]|nr:hypothetical protein TYRP_018852 [Tyrophagus putrescentiae]